MVGGRRGKEAAALDARGAVLGGFGLTGFALMVWLLIGWSLTLALALAAVTWAVVSISAWKIWRYG